LFAQTENINLKILELIMINTITSGALERALHLRDLSDPQQGAHAMQQIVETVHTALAQRWRCQRLLYRGSPLVSVQDNYDRLGYQPEGVVRDARYTRYVTPQMMLRAHTSAMIPGLLRGLAVDPPEDILLVCPGLVYRRDTIDRLHTGEPHHLDLWRITKESVDVGDLNQMVLAVVNAALPGYQYRTVPSLHPYTTNGIQIDVAVGDQWIEIGECGLASLDVLRGAGLQSYGLAMGLGLDRILMIRKSIDDIRILRSPDARVQKQMLDLDQYIPVSNQPAIRRDLSIAVDDGLTAEELGDKLRQASPMLACRLESVEIISETPYPELPPEAHARMGMKEQQKNVLLRLVIRDPVATLTSHEANEIRDLVYGALHQGERMELSNS
jgi:phenylalanyl-tRNA synthetase alpha chain